ncbi:MAG: hypothetical protein MJ078_08775, partial [Clostridia bacterium]|nr:hypothetical protein [Clostridia bacterium]
EYVGAGGAELTNWMRSMLVIMPTQTPGMFDLMAAKRGKRLGWQSPDGERAFCPHKYIVHSEGGLVFWRDAPDGTIPSGKTKVDDSRPAFDPKADAQRLADNFKQIARTLTGARNFAKEIFGRKRGDAAYDALAAKPSEFGVEIRPTGVKNHQHVIGSLESIEKSLADLRGEAMQKMACKGVKK